MIPCWASACASARWAATSVSKAFAQAPLPVTETPKPPLKDGLAVGQAPSGKAIKFVHRGSFSDLDSTYEAITDYLDEKGMDAKDEFIEEYVTDIRKASPDHLVVNIYVPVK